MYSNMNIIQIIHKFVSGISGIIIFMIYCILSTHVYADDVQSYVWYDGSKPYKIWLKPDYIAEIGPFMTSSSKSRIRQLDKKAKIEINKGGIRIWKVKDIILKKSLSKGKIPSSLKGSSYSPVFTDYKHGGPKRALYGNVIVSLNPNWSKAKVKSWAKSNKLVIVEKLQVKGNYYIIKTPPGMTSLTKANDIRLMSGVISAYPNWWVERTHR